MTLGIGRDPGCDALTVLEAPEHDLNAITPSVAARVVFHDPLVRPPAKDADLYSPVFESFSQPVSVMSPVRQQPFGLSQVSRQRRRWCGC